MNRQAESEQYEIYIRLQILCITFKIASQIPLPTKLEHSVFKTEEYIRCCTCNLPSQRPLLRCVATRVPTQIKTKNRELKY